MSKIARAARVASRQRIETITADKTIATAETGETYLIDYNSAANLTITLPAKQDGAYFKFIFATKTANGSAHVVITSAEDTDGDFEGSIFEQVTGGSDAASAVQLCGNHHKLTLNDQIDIGSYVECYCDGTRWFFTGHISVNAVGKAVFSS